MTGQLDIFHDSGREQADADPSTGTPAQPPAASTAAASRSGPPGRTYEGTLGDDGSLHWMLTGQPEPKIEAA